MAFSASSAIRWMTSPTAGPVSAALVPAVAEVEDYTRIKATAGTNAALTGPAVGDVIHLIAELAENATMFSPPNTPVTM